MSLHIGNLSSRIQREDLKRTFDRFGKNRLDIRDKFGFVIYDIPRDAENAHRKLQGKYICGERIPVTWSNKQPRYLKGSKVNEPFYRRNFRLPRRERGFKLEGGEPRLDEIHTVETNSADGRWGEPVSGWDKKEVGNDVGRDLFEGGDEDRNRYKANSDASSVREKSGEDSRKGRDGDDLENEPECNDCEVIGHLSRYRLDGNVSNEDKFDSRGPERYRDASVRDRSKRGFKRIRGESRGRLDRTRINSPLRLKERHGRSVGSKKLPMSVKDEGSPLAKVSKYKRLRREKKEDGNSEKEGKKAGIDGSSPQRSGSIASSGLSPTSPGTRSLSRSPAGTRFRISAQRTRSASSGSRSTSMLSKLRSDNSRPKSKSVSPEALPLPVLQSQPLRSSPDKVDVEGSGTSSDNHLKEDNGRESTQSLIDQRPPIGDDSTAENSKLKTTDGTVLIEFSLTKADDGMNMNCDRQLHKHGSHELDKIDYGMDSPSMNPSERVQGDLEDYSPENREQRNDSQQSGPLDVEDVQFSCEKLNGEQSIGVEIKNSTNISSREMYMVLKHYGLATPNEKGENLSVENYFGSARMWPWELIYYRRLKKGAISVENYARRIAQNKEFGIVDKYIRSSSGWGECERSSF